MCTISAENKRWKISEGERILFDDIETAPQALNIAELFGLVCTEFNEEDQENGRRKTKS